MNPENSNSSRQRASLADYKHILDQLNDLMQDFAHQRIDERTLSKQINAVNLQLRQLKMMDRLICLAEKCEPETARENAKAQAPRPSARKNHKGTNFSANS